MPLKEDEFTNDEGLKDKSLLLDEECAYNQCNCGKITATAAGFHQHFLNCKKRLKLD